MTRRVITAREQHEMLSPWRRVGMAYWVAQPGDPVHHIPTDELGSYRQIHPLKGDLDPDTGWKTWNQVIMPDKPPVKMVQDGDEGFSAHDLRKTIPHQGVTSPVELLTDGQHAYLSDGNHRSAIAEELGVPSIPAHVVHLHPYDYEDYRWEGNLEDEGPGTPVGPHLRELLKSIPQKRKRSTWRES